MSINTITKGNSNIIRLTGSMVNWTLSLANRSGGIQIVDDFSRDASTGTENDYQFLRGDDATAEASDPTENVGATTTSADSYWPFDGGDYFTYGATNETWMQNIHKDNAAFTIIMWAYISSFASTQALAGTTGNSGTGFRFQLTTTDLQLQILNGASSVLSVTKAHGSPTNVWRMYSVSINEAGNVSILGINDSFTTSTATYSSPSSGNAAQTMQVGARGNGNAALLSGGRMYSFDVWNRAMGADELRSLFFFTRGKFEV